MSVLVGSVVFFIPQEIFRACLTCCFADGRPCGSCRNRRSHLHSRDFNGSSEGVPCELEHGAGPTGGTGEYRQMNEGHDVSKYSGR